MSSVVQSTPTYLSIGKVKKTLWVSLYFLRFFLPFLSKFLSSPCPTSPPPQFFFYQGGGERHSTDPLAQCWLCHYVSYDHPIKVVHCILVVHLYRTLKLQSGSRFRLFSDGTIRVHVHAVHESRYDKHSFGWYHMHSQTDHGASERHCLNVICSKTGLYCLTFFFKGGVWTVKLYKKTKLLR